MFSKHVTRELSAYCNGELSSDESRMVAEHLIACSHCREQHEEIKFGVTLAQRLPLVAAPERLWWEIGPRLAAPEVERRSWFALVGWQRTAAWSLAGLVLVGVLWLALIYLRSARPSWEVARIAGAPRIGSAQINNTGRLAVGQWLETDAASRAKIDVSSIGQVEIDPNTRIRLVETKPTEHRLELAHGKMSATIWAPPRLFFVDTPAAVAADLGCAYTMEVNDDGAGLLHVTTGWVALQLKQRESVVPAGASCQTRPGVGPGTPYFDDASDVFRRALSRFDFGEGDATKIPDLDTILLAARARDTLTLWHLLSRVNDNDRVRVYERMAALVPPPAGVTRDGVLQLDETMLQAWKTKLTESWTGSAGGVHKILVDMWTRTLGAVNGLQGKR